MTLRAPLLIDAVASDLERAALIAASEQLLESLDAASGDAWRIDVRFRDSMLAIDACDRPAVVVASLLGEVGHDEALVAIEARWREQLAMLAPLAIPATLVCTIFRHIAADSPGGDPESRPTTIERIRRLNLLAAELSNDTGVGVIDIDRVFAHLGARTLRTDYRLTGTIAAEVAGYAIASTILAFGLDDWIPPDIQEKALQVEGELRNVGRLVDRRLRRSR